ncbi:uncharacterized protein LOC144626513 [Crassostrea virginica]
MAVERQFKVSLVLKVCFEAKNDSQCILSLDVLKDTLLPKSICDWVADFSTPNFDINQWFTTESINPNAVLNLVDREKLLNKLGISSYLSVNPCSFSSEMFSPANSQGWKNGKCILTIILTIFIKT